MVRSILGPATWLTSARLATACALIGCGSSGHGQAAATSSPSGDDGVLADATSDAVVVSGGYEAGVPEAGALGEGGVSCIDGGVGPKGTQLVRSSTVSILGLTDDDQVVYVETAPNQNIFAVPAAGGMAMPVGPTEGSVGLASRAVFNWTGLNQDGTIGTALWVWTSARGLQFLADAPLVGVADSSADGTKVLFFDNASAVSADLYVAGTDGSGKVRLATGVPWVPGCMPRVSFVGSSAVLAYCSAAPAGSGSPVGTIALYVGASGAAMTLSTSALLSFQSAGAHVLYSAGGGLMLADATTGATTRVDAVAGTSARFTRDGQGVVYLAPDGSIRRSPVASPSPTALVAGGGFAGLLSLSPDGRWLLASKTSDPNTGNVDIYVAPATTAGPASAILGTATGTFYGSAFTADSSRILYVDNTANGAGDYHVAPTTGGPGSRIASRTWIGYATTGTKVVYQDGFVPGVGLNAQGIADIESMDVSFAPPGPSLQVKLLVSQADPGLYFTSARDRIVYSLTSCAGGSDGIWVMPAP